MLQCWQVPSFVLLFIFIPFKCTQVRLPADERPYFVHAKKLTVTVTNIWDSVDGTLYTDHSFFVSIALVSPRFQFSCHRDNFLTHSNMK